MFLRVYEEVLLMKTRRIQEVTRRWLALVALVLALLPWVGPVRADTTLDEQLIEAVHKGDLKTVTTLLEKGAAVNARDPDGRTGLMWAARMGPSKIVELLIREGAELNGKGKRGETALMMAMAGGLATGVYTVKLLLDSGADVNARDMDGRTALMYLLEPSISVVAKSSKFSYGEPFVHSNGEVRYGSGVLLDDQARDQYKNIVQLLLEKGAKVNPRDKEGRTALMRCLEPLVEIKGDSVAVAKHTGDDRSFKFDVGNGTVLVKRPPPNEIVELLKAHGATE
jgi:hypothetical protein